MVAKTLPGGAAQVRVSTFSKFQPGGRVVEPIDNWDRNHIAHTQFREFFSGYVNGQVLVRESLAPYSKPLGPVSYGGRNRQKSRAVGVPSWYAQLPGEPGSETGRSEEEARLHDGDCGSVHPYQTHGDWARSSEEEEERQRLRARTAEGYLRTLITESHEPNCPLRQWAVRKLRR